MITFNKEKAFILASGFISLMLASFTGSFFVAMLWNLIAPVYWTNAPSIVWWVPLATFWFLWLVTIGLGIIRQNIFS